MNVNCNARSFLYCGPRKNAQFCAAFWDQWRTSFGAPQAEKDSGCRRSAILSLYTWRFIILGGRSCCGLPISHHGDIGLAKRYFNSTSCGKPYRAGAL